MRLHAPVNDTGRKAWCGPTALAVLTGKPLSAFMPRGRGAMMAIELQEHLRAAGFLVVRRNGMRNGHASELGTDGRRLRGNLGPLWRALPANASGVAVLRDHFIAFSGRMVRCPMVPDRAVWVCDHPYARRKVVSLILVERGTR